MANSDNESEKIASSSKGSAGKNNSNNTGRDGVDRRSFLTFAGVGAGAAMLGGCVSGEGTATPADTPDAAGDGGMDGATDTPTEEGGMDGGATETSTEAFSLDGPIRIGAMGPAESPTGASILRGAELAASEINADGGIAGADVEIVTKDTQDDPSVARSAYQELTTGQGVDYTVGIFGSEQLLAIMPDVADQETIHLSTGAATPEATRRVSQEYDRFKYYFRAGPTNSRFLGQSLIEFAQARFDAMGWDSVGLLVEDFRWTEPVRDVLDGEIGSLGVDVPVQNVVPEGTEDFTPIYDDLTSADVDGCYTVLAHIGTPALVQWAQQQRPFGFGGIHVLSQFPSYYGATNGACRFVFSNNTATPTSEVTPKTVPFANAYNEQFDKYPVYDGYITYDAVYLLKTAIEAARTTDDEELVPVLEQINRGGPEYVGAAGIPSFYGRDHEFTHDLRYNENTRGLFFQWQAVDGEGSQQVLWPDDLATTEYRSPPWV